jgi:hypothetical protein
MQRVAIAIPGRRWTSLAEAVSRAEYALVNEHLVLFAVDGIWHDIDPWLRNRIDCWIEERVRTLSPRYVVSYTEFGGALLARALQSRPEAKPIHLGNYLDLHGPGGLDKLKEVTKEDVVVLLLDISGSGKTIQMVVDNLESRGAIVHVVCLIDTISVADRRRRPQLDGFYLRGKVEALVSQPIGTP